MIDLSIILVSWNTRSFLDRCLNSVFCDLRATPNLSAEVWVVDNASSDDSIAMVRERHSQAYVIEPRANLGFGRANNLALARAQGEFVLFLNPDTQIKETGVLAGMVQTMRKHPEIGALGCRLENADGTTQTSHWDTYPGIKALVKNTFHLDRVQRSAATETAGLAAHLLGAALLCRTAAVRSLGGFDENYFLYLEETDLCFAIARSGQNLMYDPGHTIIHFGQQSSLQISHETSLYFVDSYLHFIRKNISVHPIYLTLIRLLLFIAAASHMAKAIIKLIVSADKSQKQRAIQGFFWAACYSIGVPSRRPVPTSR